MTACGSGIAAVSAFPSKLAIDRRSFLRRCAAGTAGLLVDAYGLTTGLEAQAAPAGRSIHVSSGKTVCGCYNIPSPAIGKEIGAQATRLIFGVAGLERQLDLMLGGTLPRRLQLVIDLANAGIPVIATYCWIAKRKRKLPERGSTEWRQWLGIAERFVQVMGPHLAGVTLENEPISSYVPSDFAPDRDGIVPATEWFKTLAAMIRKTAPHLLISSPAFNTLEFVIGRPDTENSKANAVCFEWARSDRNVDVIDVHAHAVDVQEVDTMLTYAKAQFPRGIIITEWSEQRRFRSWDPLIIDRSFAVKWKRHPALTNEEYIANCERNPVAGLRDSRVSLDEWNDFVATAPINPDFMRGAFKIMKSHGVLMAAYGAAIQYGNPVSDLKQLYANLTVVPGWAGAPQPNYKFPSWFKELSALDLAQVGHQNAVGLNGVRATRE